jgi:hypothetical protein
VQGISHQHRACWPQCELHHRIKIHARQLSAGCLYKLGSRALVNLKALQQQQLDVSSAAQKNRAAVAAVAVVLATTRPRRRDWS